MTSVQSDPETSNFVSWNADLESIFNVPLLSHTVSENKKRKSLSSHRLLTSDEIIKENVQAAENKIKKKWKKSRGKESGRKIKTKSVE